jgi:hypothetical protein
MPQHLKLLTPLPVLIALVFGLVLTLPWEPDVVKDLQRNSFRLAEWESWQGDGFTRVAQKFACQSAATLCEGWLYLPTELPASRRRVRLRAPFPAATASPPSSLHVAPSAARPHMRRMSSGPGLAALSSRRRLCPCCTQATTPPHPTPPRHPLTAAPPACRRRLPPPKAGCQPS